MRRSSIAALLLAVVAAGCGADAADTTEPSERAAGTTTFATSAAVDSTAVTAPSADPFILHGERGAYVTALQFLLDCAGYGPVTVDGVFGDETATAVRKAQTAEGKTPTGEADEATFAALGRGCDRWRTINIAEGETGIEVAGNAAEGDADHFELTALAGQSMSIDAEMRAPVDISVQGADGAVLHPGGVKLFTVEIPTTQKYTIRVTAPGPASYKLIIEISVAPSDGTTSSSTAASGAFDPADWIGLEWSVDPPGGLLDFGSNFDCPGEPSDSECFNYYGIVVGAPGTLDHVSVPAEGEPGEPVELMAWLIHEVGRDGSQAVWEIVDAEVFSSKRGYEVHVFCNVIGSDNAVVGVSESHSGGGVATVHDSVDWSVDDEDIMVIAGNTTQCFDGAGDVIAAGVDAE